MDSSKNNVLKPDKKYYPLDVGDGPRGLVKEMFCSSERFSTLKEQFVNGNTFIDFGKKDTFLLEKDKNEVFIDKYKNGSISFVNAQPLENNLSISQDELKGYQERVKIYLNVKIDDSKEEVKTLGEVLESEDLRNKNKELLEALKLILEYKSKNGKNDDTSKISTEDDKNNRKKILEYQHKICMIGTVPVFHEWVNAGVVQKDKEKKDVAVTKTVGLKTLNEKREQTVMSMPAWPYLSSDNSENFNYEMENLKSLGKGNTVTAYKTVIEQTLKLQVEVAKREGKNGISVTVPSAFLNGIKENERKEYFKSFEAAVNEVAKSEGNFKFYISNANPIISKRDSTANKIIKEQINLFSNETTASKNIIIADCDSAEINRCYGKDGKKSGEDIALPLVPHPYKEVGNGCFEDSAAFAGDERFARLCPLVIGIMGVSQNNVLQENLKKLQKLSQEENNKGKQSQKNTVVIDLEGLPDKEKKSENNKNPENVNSLSSLNSNVNSIGVIENNNDISRTKNRFNSIREMIIDNIINNKNYNIKISDDAKNTFINGKDSELIKCSENEKQVIIQNQLSELPNDYKFCNTAEKKFPCDVSVNYDNENLSVSLTFDKSLLLSSSDNCKTKIQINFPKGKVIISPNLIEAIREKKLGEYLKTSGASFGEKTNLKADYEIYKIFFDRFNENCNMIAK